MVEQFAHLSNFLTWANCSTEKFSHVSNLLTWEIFSGILLEKIYFFTYKNSLKTTQVTVVRVPVVVVQSNKYSTPSTAVGTITVLTRRDSKSVPGTSRVSIVSMSVFVVVLSSSFPVVRPIPNPANLGFHPTIEAVEAAFRASLLLQGWASADRIAAALCRAPAMLISCFYFWWFVVSPRPRPTSYMSWKNFYFLQKRACNKFLEQIAHLSKILAWAKCSHEQIAHLSNLLTLAKYLARLKSSQPYSKGGTKLPLALSEVCAWYPTEFYSVCTYSRDKTHMHSVGRKKRMLNIYYILHSCMSNSYE